MLLEKKPLLKKGPILPTSRTPSLEHPIQGPFINQQPPEQRRWLYRSPVEPDEPRQEPPSNFVRFSAALFCLSFIGYILCLLVSTDYQSNCQRDGTDGTGPWCDSRGWLTFMGIEASLFITATLLLCVWGFVSVDRSEYRRSDANVGVVYCTLTLVFVGFSVLGAYRGICPDLV